jgi:ketosteroid isomerase-like protein
MKRLVLAALFLSTCSGLTFGQAMKQAAKAPSATASIKQLEHEWVDAAKANDMEKLGQILADDWTGISPDGEKMNKQAYLDMYKSGKSKVESIDLGSMDVKIIGTVAVVQGTDKEKSTLDGKDSSGKYAWMDVFAKRDGKWVAIRSQTAKAK